MWESSVSGGTFGTVPPATRLHLHAAKQLRQTLPQSSGNLFNVHQRHIPDPSLDTAVVRPVQPAPLRSLFLIDLLLLANTANRTAESDADIERHRGRSWPRTAYA
jgi:hypothetical protein